MNTIQTKRIELQEQAANTLYQNHRLLCQWATGVGKSGVVLRFLSKHSQMNCLILVPESNNIDNWLAEFDKFGVSTLNVTIICYASLHKYNNTSWDLIVFDEAPHIDTEKRKKICSSISGTYILALGAVIDEDELFTLEDTYGYFKKSYVSLKQAITYGILPSPTIHICHIKLDDKIHCFPYKGSLLTAEKMYAILQKNVSDAVTSYNSFPTQWNKQRMLRAGNVRKKFLGQLKENVVKSICSSLETSGKRFLCFCSSIKQAESLNKQHAFTSKTPTSFDLLNKFNNHEIDSLFVVGKLIEGQNLVDVEEGVITQLGATRRITVQFIGRIMRSKNPIIWIPVFNNTKDNSFLYTLTSNIPNNYIKHHNL